MLQTTLFEIDVNDTVAAWLVHILARYEQPSAAEIVERVEKELGLDARFALLEVARALADDHAFNRHQRDYLLDLLAPDALPAALNGGEKIGNHVESSIDALIASCGRYKTSDTFREMVNFVARFRDYSPYNNMLVKVQNPSCGFFATQKHWKSAFGRDLIEDARPMLILMPMGPVLCVYDLDQTEGEWLPDELKNFAKFEGVWDSKLLTTAIKNADNFKIKVGIKKLSSVNAGFATTRAKAPSKMRIALSDELDERSQFGVLCHELAHIFLGHLGRDEDAWWPSRVMLSHAAMEMEAESVAYIVTGHLGLSGSSDAYIVRHAKGQEIPVGVSFDNISRVAGLLKKMATEAVRPRIRAKTTKTVSRATKRSRRQ